jgi:hypothetical protein
MAFDRDGRQPAYNARSMRSDETMNVTTLGRTSLVVAASDGPGG